MFEHIVIIVSVVILVVAGVLAWWFENGPEKKGSANPEKNNKEGDL